MIRAKSKQTSKARTEFQATKISALADYKNFQKIQKNNLDSKFSRQIEDSIYILKKIFQIEGYRFKMSKTRESK